MSGRLWRGHGPVTQGSTRRGNIPPFGTVSTSTTSWDANAFNIGTPMNDKSDISDFEDTSDAAMRRAGVNTQGNAKKRTVSEPLPRTSGPPITLGEDEGDRAEGKTVKVKRTREEGTTPVTPTDEAEKYKAMVAAMTAEVDEQK